MNELRWPFQELSDVASVDQLQFWSQNGSLKAFCLASWNRTFGRKLMIPTDLRDIVSLCPYLSQKCWRYEYEILDHLFRFFLCHFNFIEKKTISSLFNDGIECQGTVGHIADFFERPLRRFTSYHKRAFKFSFLYWIEGGCTRGGLSRREASIISE